MANNDETTTPSPPLNTEFIHEQKLSGMRRPKNVSEWQLQAVLFKAKLTQYFDVFISQGGDDIDQIMQCDEQEFLEIMSLVGMASKPLHVRRLQRTLNEFSLNREQFLINSVPFIGVPPANIANMPANSENYLATALQLLAPEILPRCIHQQKCALKCDIDAPQKCNSSSENSIINEAETKDDSTLEFESTTEMSSLTSPISSTTTIDMDTIGVTANVLPFTDNFLMDLVKASMAASSLITSTTSKSIDSNTSVNLKYLNDVHPKYFQQETIKNDDHFSTISQNKPSAYCSKTSNDFDNAMNTHEIYKQAPSTSSCTNVFSDDQLFEIPNLMPDEAKCLAQFAPVLCEQIPSIEPGFVENKKKISGELLDIMSLPPTSSKRIAEFRRFSAIYGRFDAKCKPDKALTFHEALINEAAAQLCLCRPELLTRRDELFSLARKLVLLTGLYGLQVTYHQRPDSEINMNNCNSGGEGITKSENDSRTTSRSSNITNSTSPSPTPFRKMNSNIEERKSNETIPSLYAEGSMLLQCKTFDSVNVKKSSSSIDSESSSETGTVINFGRSSKSPNLNNLLKKRKRPINN